MFGQKRKKQIPERSFFLGEMESREAGNMPFSDEDAFPLKEETGDALTLKAEKEISPKKTEPEKVAGEKNAKKHRHALRNIPNETKGKNVASPEIKPEKKRKPFPKKAKRDVKKDPEPSETYRSLFPMGEAEIKASLEGMYGVYSDPEKNKKKTLGAFDYVRYGILFVCIFGFLTASFFVFRKLYDYYRAYVVYSGLQEMVSEKDRFADEYLKKALVSVETLTPADILAGKTHSDSAGNSTFTSEQETLVGKIAQLKKINADTAGWIKIEGTVVNYPIVWSSKRNYYLHRDFYGKTLSGGAIFIDPRNSSNIPQNRNTVIYGHNMSDGSMFASVHDFASASVFYSATIEIATSDGIYIYEPFSVHESNAFDNYFETDFVSDVDFINFCEQMAFISLYETEHTFNKNSQIITLSTCDNNEHSTDRRFAVHAVLSKVIR